MKNKQTTLVLLLLVAIFAFSSCKKKKKKDEHIPPDVSFKSGGNYTSEIKHFRMATAFL
jgi:hypothetical protein